MLYSAAICCQHHLYGVGRLAAPSQPSSPSVSDRDEQRGCGWTSALLESCWSLAGALAIVESWSPGALEPPCLAHPTALPSPMRHQQPRRAMWIDEVLWQYQWRTPGGEVEVDFRVRATARQLRNTRPTLAAADSISLYLRPPPPPCLLRAPPPRPGPGKVQSTQYQSTLLRTAESDPLPSLTEIPSRRFRRVALRRVAFMLPCFFGCPFIYLPWPATTSFAPLLPRLIATFFVRLACVGHPILVAL